MTGVRAPAGRPAGRRTSACSSTSLPSEEGKYSSVQSALSGTRGFSSWETGWSGDGMGLALATTGAASAAPEVRATAVRIDRLRERVMGHLSVRRDGASTLEPDKT